ncbi:hypothetical protein LP414_27440 [Polaromonas sp. P1(28)-13]|nr:hypothetical protein LP414_27440 [Polaromonas sp. P1(28)-13]
MADIKRFTGFIAPDGSTHDTIKKATEHAKAVKVKDALVAEFTNITPHTHGNNVTEDDVGMFVVGSADMPMFLLDNRERILACFNQEVLLRATQEEGKARNAGHQLDHHRRGSAGLDPSPTNNSQLLTPRKVRGR